MEAVREEIKMFIPKSHRVIYEALAGNQCRGLGEMASPAQSSPVLCKVFVSVSPQIEMGLSGHPLRSPCLHPGSVLYSTASSVLCPSTSPAAPERRKNSLSRGWLWPCPFWQHVFVAGSTLAQVRLSQLYCIFRSCRTEDMQNDSRSLNAEVAFLACSWAVWCLMLLPDSYLPREVQGWWVLPT